MLKKFIVEQKIQGLGPSCYQQFQEMALKSNAVISELGHKIQWKESYVTEDKIYGVYIAETKDLIYEHARLTGFSVDKIAEVKMLIDPLTAYPNKINSTGLADQQSECAC